MSRVKMIDSRRALEYCAHDNSLIVRAPIWALFAQELSTKCPEVSACPQKLLVYNCADNALY